MADPTDDQEPQEPDDPKESSVIKELRAKAKRADDAETRAAQAERKLALHEAGLSGLNERQVTALLATHEGDLSAEALKATATDLGFAGNAQPVEEPDRGGELAQLDQFAQPSSQVQPPRSGREAFDRELAQFDGSQEEYKAFLLANAQYLAPR